MRPGDEASATFLLSGLDAFVRMPVRVSGGRLTFNGIAIEAGAHPPAALGFFTSSQQPAMFDMEVSHLAPLTLDETTVTALEFGGVVRSSNLALTVGPTVSATFSSVTRDNPMPNGMFSDGFEAPVP